MKYTLSSASFPSECRIRKRYEYQLLFQKGRRIALPHFVIYYQVRDSGVPRLGLTVSRKVGAAVVRNRCKRYLREIFRTTRADLVPVDLSIQLRPSAAGLTQQQLAAEFRQFLRSTTLVRTS